MAHRDKQAHRVSVAKPVTQGHQASQEETAHLAREANQDQTVNRDQEGLWVRLDLQAFKDRVVNWESLVHQVYTFLCNKVIGKDTRQAYKKKKERHDVGCTL